MTASNENSAFFLKLKQDSERLWENGVLRRDMKGFHIQPGAKWLPGLSEAEIDAFEKDMDLSFPQVYRDFLTCMNGTDQEWFNRPAESGYPYTHGPGYLSYPRDTEIAKDRILWIYESFGITEEDVRAQGIPHILPIVFHRFLIVDNCATNPVLSMYGDDVIMYAADLCDFLVYDIFHKGSRPPNLPSPSAVKYWLDDRD